jgi:excisionase family DNA binding protein
MARALSLNGAASRPTLADLPPVLNPEEVADYYGLGVDTVREMIRDGKLPALRPGRLMLIPRASLEAHERRLGEISAEKASEARP